MRQSLNHLGIIQVIVNYYVNVYYPYNLDKSYYDRNCINSYKACRSKKYKNNIV